MVAHSRRFNHTVTRGWSTTLRFVKGGICFALSMYTGATMVLRRKFSATHFMSDIREHRCTLFEVRMAAGVV